MQAAEECLVGLCSGCLLCQIGPSFSGSDVALGSAQVGQAQVDLRRKVEKLGFLDVLVCSIQMSACLFDAPCGFVGDGQNSVRFDDAIQYARLFGAYERFLSVLEGRLPLADLVQLGGGTEKHCLFPRVADAARDLQTLLEALLGLLHLAGKPVAITEVVARCSDARQVSGRAVQLQAGFIMCASQLQIASLTLDGAEDSVGVGQAPSVLQMLERSSDQTRRVVQPGPVRWRIPIRWPVRNVRGWSQPDQADCPAMIAPVWQYSRASATCPCSKRTTPSLRAARARLSGELAIAKNRS